MAGDKREMEFLDSLYFQLQFRDCARCILDEDGGRGQALPNSLDQNFKKMIHIVK
jgi:hypothetical protein